MHSKSTEKFWSAVSFAKLEYIFVHKFWDHLLLGPPAIWYNSASVPLSFLAITEACNSKIFMKEVLDEDWNLCQTERKFNCIWSNTFLINRFQLE